MTVRKKGLGRGLDALLKVETPAVQTLSLDRLRPNRLQPRSRFEGADLEELAASIRAQGVVQPILVSPRADGDYTIVAGERRWRAARRAGLEEVPVVVREVAGDRHLLEMALVENLQRTDLNPVEEARAYQRLQQEFGLSHEQIATRVGKSRSAVTNALRLLKLPEEVRELLREGRLTAGQARPLLALASDAERVALARRAASGGLSARALEAKAAGKQARRPAAAPDPDSAAAAERLTRRLQTRVSIHRRGGGGHLRIAFHSEDELMRLYELLMQAGRRE